jgi:transcription elongation factor Elf1
MEYFFTCPYCWQEISFVLDLSQPEQEYIEDCEICCNPVKVSFTTEEGEITNFEAEKIQ